MAKGNDWNADVLSAVTRALRHARPELRTQLMELVVGSMIDAGNWGSLSFWHGELERALMKYFEVWERNGEAVCQHCFRNLGLGLQERLKGRVVIEHAVR
jgi:hypothetical protein